MWSSDLRKRTGSAHYALVPMPTLSTRATIGLFSRRRAVRLPRMIISSVFRHCRRFPLGKSVRCPVERSNRMGGRCIGAAILLALTGSGAAFAAGADRGAAAVDRGAHIARMVCSYCHVAADDQPFPPRLAQSTPSFREIANRPGTNLKELRHFIATTHWDRKTLPARMPDPMLTKDDVTAVSKYIMSLRHQP